MSLGSWKPGHRLDLVTVISVDWSQFLQVLNLPFGSTAWSVGLTPFHAPPRNRDGTARRDEENHLLVDILRGRGNIAHLHTIVDSREIFAKIYYSP